MGWRHIRRTLTALGLLLALIMAFWPQFTRYAHADPTVSANPASGAPGAQVTLTVSNPGTLTPGDQIDAIFFPQCDVESHTFFQVQSNGTLPPITITVPSSANCPSSYSAEIFLLVGAQLIGSVLTFQVNGNTGGGTATATVTGTPPTGTASATPTTPTTTQFILNPSVAALGQPIGFTAGGFNPNEQVSLSILVNGTTLPLTTISGSLIADSTGRVTGTFILPANNQTILANSAGGNAGYTAMVSIAGANQLSKQQATLTVPPTSINAGANAIIPGSTMTITGGGFASGEGVSLTLINVNNNNAVTNLTTVTAGIDGTVSTTATAPTANATYILKAIGLTSGMIATQQLTIGTPIGLTVSPLIALVGQTITVTGFGFTHNATITISNLDGGPLTVNSDSTGAFTTTSTVPTSAPPGSVITVHATDQNGLGASTFLSVDNGQAATIGVSPGSASPGQILSVSGTNYAAGENVSVELATNASPPIPITSTVELVPVDGTRAFTTTLTVPALTDGLYLLVATGQSSGRTAVTSVTVGSGLPTATATATTNPGYVAFPTLNIPTAPPTATPTLPPNGLQTTYFAEGFTGQAKTNGRASFTESLNLFNSRALPGSATITYYVLNTNGSTTQKTKQVTLAALSASTLSVNADAGNDRQVSIAVAHSPGVVAQMLLQRTSPSGATLDAASSSGSNQAATTWNFAEGYTGEEFQEYLSIFNPNPAAASVQVRFLPASGAPPAPVTYTVGPNGRQSINVRSAYLGLAGRHAAKSVAIIVNANQKIVADRVLYWGAGSGSGKFGYEVAPGIPTGATSLSFPGLLIGGANEPYITALNPGAARAGLQVIFRDAAGRTLASYTTGIAPLTRLTLAVRTILHAFTGAISATIVASRPLVAEAPNYLGGSPNRGAHPGVTLLGASGATTAAVAGYAGVGAGLYVFNPGPLAVQVTRQIGGSAGSAGSASFTVPPLGLALTTLPAASGPHGLVLSANGPFTAAVINGGAANQSAWGGTLIAP